MGAKIGLLLGSDGDIKDTLQGKPVLNKYSTEKLVKTLFPDQGWESIGKSDLFQTYSTSDDMLVGSFRDLVVISSKKFICEPEKIDSVLINAINKKFVYLVVMVDKIDKLVFAKWEYGKPIRVLSVSPDKGTVTDEGNKLPCERSYWDNHHRSQEQCENESGGELEREDENQEQENNEYPLPFHPIDLGETLLKEVFGFQLAPHYYRIKKQIDKSLPHPNKLPLLAYKRNKQWWKVW